ncbi:hypothetical protein CYMTET_6487 [Cymbomonas tetramitiformis]|uniref:Uncharacterized protein n=1 Tax=Cymbomonas tetramitiformis TaxID=36881 RepID=A0AAE0GXI1_9CHLO|nr:hypothetical protein CYMTET_6487 [Cymbomonas tetramitiformis]
MVKTPESISKGKRNRRNKGAELVFDPDAHKEWVTGFSKRKKQRQKVAQQQIEEKQRQQRIDDRKKRRAELKHGAGSRAAPEDADDDDGGETRGTEHLEEYEGVVEYGNGSVVTVEALVPDEGKDIEDYVDEIIRKRKAENATAAPEKKAKKDNKLTGFRMTAQGWQRLEKRKVSGKKAQKGSGREKAGKAKQLR